MQFDYKILIGVFIKRPNRFIAHVLLDGEEVIAHVPNTGRMKELCVEGVRVGLSYHDSPTRKTKYELRLIEKDNAWISIDSQLPNRLAVEAIEKKLVSGSEKYENTQREVKYKNSRFDVYLSNNDETKGCFIEVKGVTLERDGWTYFPDAPTDRGTKHLRELMDAYDNGYKAKVLLIVQLDNARGFTPNYETDPKFSSTLEEAVRKGVEVQVLKCRVNTEGVEVYEEIELVFEN